MEAAISASTCSSSMRRRWPQPLLPAFVPMPPLESADAVGLIGLALLEQWRRERTQRQTVAP